MFFGEDDEDCILPYLSIGPYLIRQKIMEERNKKELQKEEKSAKRRRKQKDGIVIKIGVSMGRFFNNQDLSDVKLKIGERVFNAHKIVLVSASDVFETMLMNAKWTEASEQEIELQEDDCNAFALSLKFIYTGKICLHIENLMSVYQIADKYNLKTLKLALCKFLHKFVTERQQQGKLTSPEAIAICNAFEGDSLMHPGLKCVIQWIGKHFTDFIKTSEWERLPRRTVVMLLQKDEVGDNEQKVFAAAKRWLEFDSSRTETPELIYEVLKHVRLTFITAKDLYGIENDPIVLKSPQMMKLVSETVRRKFYEGVPNFIGESVTSNWLKRRDRTSSYATASPKYNFEDDDDYYYYYEDSDDDDDDDYNW